MPKLEDIKTWQCEICKRTITGPGKALHLGIRSHMKAEIRSGKRGKMSNAEIRLMASGYQRPNNTSSQHPDSTSLKE